VNSEYWLSTLTFKFRERRKHYRPKLEMRAVFCLNLIVVILIILILETVAVLPPYTPAVRENEDAHEIITNYFNQGYNNYEILAFLSLLHGFSNVGSNDFILKELVK
jgi:hypothetical protein